MADGVDAEVAADEVRPSPGAFHVGVPPLPASLVAARVVDGAPTRLDDPTGVTKVAALAHPLVPARVPTEATVRALVLGALEVVADGPGVKTPSRVPLVGAPARALRTFRVHDAAAHGVPTAELPRTTGVADVAAPAEARHVAVARARAGDPTGRAPAIPSARRRHTGAASAKRREPPTVRRHARARVGARVVAAATVRAIATFPLPPAEDAVPRGTRRPKGVVRVVVPPTSSGATSAPTLRKAAAAVAPTMAVEAGREGVRPDGVAIPDALRAPTSPPSVRPPAVGTVRDGDVTPVPAQNVRAIYLYPVLLTPAPAQECGPLMSMLSKLCTD